MKVFFMAVLLIAQAAHAVTRMQFQWSNPIMREDGAAVSIADVSHYELIKMDKSCSGAEYTLILPAGQTMVDLGPDWGEGYCFKMRVIGVDGSKSAYTQPIII